MTSERTEHTAVDLKGFKCFSSQIPETILLNVHMYHMLK